MPADLLVRKQTKFVLWRPGRTDLAPTLFIGNFQVPAADLFAGFREIPLPVIIQISISIILTSSSKAAKSMGARVLAGSSLHMINPLKMRP